MAIEEYLYDIDDFSKKLAYQLFTEFFGTFVLAFLIQGSVITGVAHEVRPDHMVSTGLCICCAIIIAIYLCGPTSGAHINPALSVCALLSGRMNAAKVALYSLAQIFGGIGATGVIALLSPSKWAFNEAYQQRWLLDFSPEVSFQQGIFIEILATMLLALVFLLVTDPVAGKELGNFGPIIMGVAATGIFLSLAPLTKCCMNPAIALGQSIAMAHFEVSLAAYVIGPLTGAAAASLIYNTLLVHGIRHRDEYEELKLVLNYKKADSKYDG